jgi:predicted nuclease with TOPRIM domain
MTMRQPRTGNLLAMRAETGEKFDKFPAARFPVQHEIQQLQKELNDFNERIIELENEGHRGHAMEVLKANAIDFARRIDELRCLLGQRFLGLNHIRRPRRVCRTTCG